MHIMDLVDLFKYFPSACQLQWGTDKVYGEVFAVRAPCGPLKLGWTEETQTYPAISEGEDKAYE